MDIWTIYLCQGMTGTCLIKISDVLTLCQSNFIILSGELHLQKFHMYTHVWCPYSLDWTTGLDHWTGPLDWILCICNYDAIITCRPSCSVACYKIILCWAKGLRLFWRISAAIDLNSYITATWHTFGDSVNHVCVHREHKHVHKHTHVYVFWVSASVCVHVFVTVYMCVNVCVRTRCACMCTYMCGCVRIDVCMHVQVCVDACVYIKLCVCVCACEVYISYIIYACVTMHDTSQVMLVCKVPAFTNDHTRKKV